MTIKYKFNKSSEARDCVVESVELYEMKSELLTDGFRLYNPLHALTLEKWVRGMFDYKFTSPQQLKDYINTIQEPIEFIAESSIDDVLMKEWIGEWDTILYCERCNNEVSKEDICGYYGDSGRESLCDQEIKNIKTGSPKLNLNWSFKIN